MITRRLILATPLLSTPAWAQAPAKDYPNKSIRIVSPGSPGSASHVLARHIGNGLSRAWGQAVVVDNKLGASGNIASDTVAKAPGDGYTLLVTYSLHYTNLWIDKVSYDPAADFEPIARFANSSLVMATGANSPYKTVRDVIEAAKKKPGEITYASSGTGTTSHMAGALFENLAGIKLSHIPYKAPGPAAIAAAGGMVDLSFNGTATALPLITGGRLRALAITAAARSTHLPQVPTFVEAGVPGYELTSPIWILAPRGTPLQIVKKLSDEVIRIASSPDFKEVTLGQGVDIDIQDAATFRASVPGELAKWKRMVELTSAKTN
ncbi:MAG: tripartite tricarboxylate transporter substrate binding protein [Ottowia sp.]|uniref:tripartite tricarboxylate transporter substrate binding protein n=1 Tax=Ottowia sp. TaxID=1898956 RepID=UPI003C75D34E